jgi:thiamine-phosphate pyrophosphorylase
MYYPIWQLMLITQLSNASLSEYLNFISHCSQAGITAVQLREKNLSYSELLYLGQELKKMLDPMHIPLIINDHLELCLELNAAGLHLGQKDGNIENARKRLGPHKILGLTVNTLEQVEKANDFPIDYIGVGAIFPSKNKPDVESIWQISGLKQAVNRSRHPIVAIGGVDDSNASAVMAAGASGIAAIGAFHNAIQPEKMTQKLKAIVERV